MPERPDKFAQREKVLRVNRAKAAEMTGAVLNGLPGCGLGEVLFDRDVTFDDGRRMSIQVIASEQPGEPAWAQGVVFDRGGPERSRTPVGNSFLGKYLVEVDGTTYVTTVVAEEE